jgi:hypothetical protein
MKVSVAVAVLAVTLASCEVYARDELCSPLKMFVKSIQPNQTQSIEFRTIRGQFKGSLPSSTDIVISEKRCENHGYAPAEAVCTILMESGLTEFSGENAKRVLSCLSPKTKFGNMMQLETGQFSFHVGTDYRGSNIELVFREDAEIGGMILAITARGY